MDCLFCKTIFTTVDLRVTFMRDFGKSSVYKCHNCGAELKVETSTITKPTKQNYRINSKENPGGSKENAV
jgi:hypothetical protein